MNLPFVPENQAQQMYAEALNQLLDDSRPAPPKNGKEYESQADESIFNVTVSSGSKTTTTENVTFMDQNPAWSYSVDNTPDPTFAQADMSDATLGNFLQRPVKIASFDWTVASGSLFQIFNPWKLFCEDPHVLARISNYNLLRMRLHVKVVLNGNGFHYGRAIMSYNPMSFYDTMTKIRAGVSADIISGTIRPHIFMDPTTSMGGEMALPFFFHKNALSVPGSEWDTMGELCLCSINDLRHANGASDNVRINVFAWAEDVTLSVPTTVAPAVTYTSQAEEYGKPVSGPATALANAAGMLTNIPGIGLYARASQLALSGVAGVASLFGYCRPVTVKEISPFKPTVVGNMANTNVPDTSQKLTTDIKQETTIDPRTTGLAGVDEMNIKSIATRETFLTTVPWNGATNSGTKLFTCSVTPYLFDIHEEVGQKEIHMLPCCHVASIFENWRGSMKFRIQVVASNFHKGRLQIQYDPYTSSVSSFNSAYNRIIDIAEEKDFTVEIGWGVQHPYCVAYEPTTRVPPFQIGSGNIAFPINQPDRFNGQISIWVLNELTSASTDIADIELNVFACCGDDIEFANPTDHMVEQLVVYPTTPGTLYTSQAAEQDAPDVEQTTEPSRPLQGTDITTMASTMPESSNISAVCFGEKITTLRSLLKRFTLSQICGAPAGATIMRQIRNNRPYYRGYANDALHTTSGAVKFNFVRDSLINYIICAFAGYRGGFRWKNVIISNTGDPISPSMITVSRKAFGGASYSETFTAFPNKTTMSSRASWVGLLTSGIEGLASTGVTANPVLEVEIPYHQNDRFVPSKTADLNSQPHLGFEGQHELYCIDGSGNFDLLQYVAAADDFSAFFYLGPPVFYLESANPAPAT